LGALVDATRAVGSRTLLGTPPGLVLRTHSRYPSCFGSALRAYRPSGRRVYQPAAPLERERRSARSAGRVPGGVSDWRHVLAFPSFPYSSGRSCLRKPLRCEVAERRMLPLGVILLAPRRDHEESLVAAGEPVVPQALLFERPEEPLDHLVLLRRVERRDVLL